MRRSADEIVHLRELPKRQRWWWRLDGRSCSGCGQLWRAAHTDALDARPEWVECLECEQRRLRGDWTREVEAAFIAQAREVFPGSYEPVRSIDTAPSASTEPKQLSFDESEAA
jgi:hypothetical protein